MIRRRRFFIIRFYKPRLRRRISLAISADKELLIKPQALIDEVETGGARFKSKKLFVVMVKFIAPVFILLILVSSVLNAFGIIKI